MIAVNLFSIRAVMGFVPWLSAFADQRIVCNVDHVVVVLKIPVFPGCQTSPNHPEHWLRDIIPVKESNLVFYQILVSEQGSNLHERSGLIRCWRRLTIVVHNDGPHLQTLRRSLFRHPVNL